MAFFPSPNSSSLASREANADYTRPMIRRTLGRMFVRVSSWFGIPTINSRLDRLTEDSASLVIQQEAFEEYVRRRMEDMADDVRTSVEEELRVLRQQIAGLEARGRDAQSSAST